MNKRESYSKDLTAQAKNIIRLGYWTGAWVLTVAVAAYGPKFIWHFNTLLTVTAILLNLAIGIGMMVVNIRYLKRLDEMQQKILLESAALTLEVGLVSGISYELLEDINLITFQPEISHLIIIMALTFIVGTYVIQRRYR